MRRLRRLPVRIRLALISASLTFAILLLFVLAQVFLEGTHIREDLEGTV